MYWAFSFFCDVWIRLFDFQCTVVFLISLFCLTVLGPLEATFSLWILSSGLHCARELRASNLEHKAAVSIICILCFSKETFSDNSIYVFPFWLASWGGQNVKTFAVNVELQRRQIYRRFSAKIVAIWSPPLFFYDMGNNLWAELL